MKLSSSSNYFWLLICSVLCAAHGSSAHEKHGQFSPIWALICILWILLDFFYRSNLKCEIILSKKTYDRLLSIFHNHFVAYGNLFFVYVKQFFSLHSKHFMNIAFMIGQQMVAWKFLKANITAEWSFASMCHSVAPQTAWLQELFLTVFAFVRFQGRVRFPMDFQDAFRGQLHRTKVALKFLALSIVIIPRMI